MWLFFDTQMNLERQEQYKYLEKNERITKEDLIPWRI